MRCSPRGWLLRRLNSKDDLSNFVKNRSRTTQEDKAQRLHCYHRATARAGRPALLEQKPQFSHQPRASPDSTSLASWLSFRQQQLRASESRWALVLGNDRSRSGHRAADQARRVVGRRGPSRAPPSTAQARPKKAPAGQARQVDTSALSQERRFGEVAPSAPESSSSFAAMLESCPSKTSAYRRSKARKWIDRRVARLIRGWHPATQSRQGHVKFIPCRRTAARFLPPRLRPSNAAPARSAHRWHRDCGHTSRQPAPNTSRRSI
jgi:hypothetical protein